MKVIILNSNCESCGKNYFKLDKNRNHYTKKDKSEGYLITTKTCLTCGIIQKYNKIEWKKEKGGIKE